MAGWRRIGLKPLVIVCFVLLTSIGCVDLFNALRKGGEDGRLVSPDDLVIVEWIKKEVSTDAIFFTRPSHVQQVYLSGRKTFLGHGGIAASQGLPAGQRRKDWEIIRKGEEEAIPLIREHGITHILYSPERGAPKPEKKSKAMNRVFFSQIGTPVYRRGDYEIFEVRPDLFEDGVDLDN
jgi:hypothetical protein